MTAPRPETRRAITRSAPETGQAMTGLSPKPKASGKETPEELELAHEDAGLASEDSQSASEVALVLAELVPVMPEAACAWLLKAPKGGRPVRATI